MTDERVIAFIDGSNVYKGVRHLYEGRRPPDFDYLRLCRVLARNRNLVRIFFYGAVKKQQEDPEAYRRTNLFLDSLRRIPLCSLRMGTLSKRGDTYVEKGVDMLLAIDMIRLARLDQYDTAILISGDGDFVEAVREVHEIGKHVELACFSESQSLQLRKECESFTEITELMLRLALKSSIPKDMLTITP